MKKILASLLIFLQLSPGAFAALSQSDLSNFPTSVQLLKNPGFESSTSQWTKSSGAFTTQASTLFAGNASASWVVSSSGATLSQDMTPAQSLSGVNLEASCWVNTTASNVQVCSRTGGVAGNCANVPNTGTWQSVPVNFVAPSSGSMGVEVATTSSSSATVYVDQCYVGKATNLSQVSQTQLIGQLKIGSCSTGWSTASTSFTNYSPVSGCTYTNTAGTAIAPSTNIPGISFASLPPGNYTLRYEGVVQVTGASNSALFRFSDGTNVSNESSAISTTAAGVATSSIQETISYTAPQSNITLQIQGLSEAGGSELANIGIPASSFSTLSVYYYPLQSQIAYQASSGGLNPGEESITAATSCPIGTIPEDGTSYLRTAYPSLFAAIGTTYGAVDGTHFTVPDARGVFERGAGTNGSMTASNGSPLSTTQGASQTDMMQGHYHSYIDPGHEHTVGTGATATASGSSFTTSNYDGIGGVRVTSINATGITITSPSSDGSNGTPRAGAETRPANISHLHCIRTVSASPAPVIVGVVSSNTAGQERVERVTFNLSGDSTVAIISQSGSWVSSASAVSSIITLNITTGEFSSAPTCTVTCLNSPVGNGWGQINSTVSTGGFTLGCYSNSSTQQISAQVNVICMGPR